MFIFSYVELAGLVLSWSGQRLKISFSVLPPRVLVANLQYLAFTLMNVVAACQVVTAETFVVGGYSRHAKPSPLREPYEFRQPTPSNQLWRLKNGLSIG
jgi:hypothetical protein